MITKGKHQGSCHALGRLCTWRTRLQMIALYAMRLPPIPWEKMTRGYSAFEWAIGACCSNTSTSYQIIMQTKGIMVSQALWFAMQECMLTVPDQLKDHNNQYWHA